MSYATKSKYMKTLTCYLGEVVAFVLLDFSSAFDTVDQYCLLSVLRDRFTVYDSALTWFRSYLSGRIQTFASEDDHIGPFNVNCSVFHGSVLEPIEFIAYIIDVLELFDRHGLSHHLFADDKQVYTCAAPVESNGCRQRLS